MNGYEQVDYSRVKRDGYTILVVDAVGGITTATKLIARFDGELKKRVPETKGYYWEHCPPAIFSRQEAMDPCVKDRHYDMTTVDGSGGWHDGTSKAQSPYMDSKPLKHDPRIGNFDDCITISDSPVAGGIKLHILQTHAGTFPLWREQIPELSIKGYVDGFWRQFYLVEKYTPVPPIRGASISITINATFPLPAGKLNYSFPLFRGATNSALGFEAHLKSSEFPLKVATVCKLHLTYTYGDDEPYTLIFEPLNDAFAAVRATWRRPGEKIITNAPAPEYPEPMTWSDLRAVPKPDSDETSDLLEWFMSAIDHLKTDMEAVSHPVDRVTVLITTGWRKDRRGKRYTHAKCTSGISVFIHESAFLRGFSHSDFSVGDRLSCEMHQDATGGWSGRRVAAYDYRENPKSRNREVEMELADIIRKRLYFPIIQLWKDGRSVRDSQCSARFALAANERIAYLAGLLGMDYLPNTIKREVLFLLSCLHRDAPAECVEWLSKQVEAEQVCDPRAIGFALGDVSQEWQQNIFDRLASNPGNDAISVFAFAIWRERQFVDLFTLSALRALLKALLKRLDNICAVQADEPKKRSTKKVWGRATAESLELLLGLLRTRVSDDPEIRMLLQPHQDMTKQFAEQIDRIEEIVAESNINLFSRVQINIDKPEGVLTPDLLYALRLYLTGDDGANAIHITGISDTDED